MKNKLQVTGLLALGVLGLVALSPLGSAEQPVHEALLSGASPSAAGMVSHVIPQEGRPTTLILVSAEDRRVATYHIDPQTGSLKLKSVRDVTWDLQMDEYNSDNPTPQEVRNALPQR